jgi:hypothetical protein
LYLFTVEFGHNLEKIDSGDQIVVIIVAWIEHTFSHTFEARKVDHGIKSVKRLVSE